MTTSAMTRSGSRDQQLLAGFHAVARLGDMKAVGFQLGAHDVAHDIVIIDDQDRRLSSLAGRRAHRILLSWRKGFSGRRPVPGPRREAAAARPPGRIHGRMFYFTGAAGQAIGAQRGGAGFETVGNAPEVFHIAGGELLRNESARPGAVLAKRDTTRLNRISPVAPLKALTLSSTPRSIGRFVRHGIGLGGPGRFGQFPGNGCAFEMADPAAQRIAQLIFHRTVWSENRPCRLPGISGGCRPAHAR